jgi:FkbM family methyltransferase
MVGPQMKRAAYGVLDAITGGRGVARTISGERYRFPARWFRCYPADYEPATFGFLRDRCRPEMTVVDVGAHLGVFTVLMSRLVGPHGRVIAFEPTASTRRALVETVELNGCTNVLIRSEAAAATSGTAVLHDVTAFGAKVANSLVPFERSDTSVTVRTLAIDDLEMHVGLLKIDAEGAEFAVLCGAARTLQRYHPDISLALHPRQLEAAGVTLGEVWAQLAGYRVCHAGLVVTRDWFCAQTDLFDVQAIHEP